MGMVKIITVVLKRNGSHHITSDTMSTPDAERWADEGFNVFRIAAVNDRWALNHVNTGKVLTSDMPAPEGSTAPQDFVHLLTLKE